MRGISILAAAAAVVGWPQAALADTVTNWWDVANRYYLAGQSASGPRLPDAERVSTRAALAMFEAVNAIDRRYQSYLNFPAGDPDASQDAAAATAAFKVLVHHHPGQKAPLEESYVLAMAAIADGPDKETGRLIGEKAADAAIAAGGIDPEVPQTPYRPRTAPGEWIGASPPSLQPYWPAFRPWVIGSSDALRPPPPPPLTSADYARDYEEIRRLGGKTSKERSRWQTLIARYRQGYDLSPSVRLAAGQIGRRQVDNARMVALYQMAFDDAVQAMIAAKYRYDYWRPITAIRNGDRDGNDATQHEPGWDSLLPNPNFPEYPCGHCAAAAAQAEVLKLVSGLPPSAGVLVASAGNPNLVLQTARNWDELVQQVSDSRMYGGVHFRFSNDAGEEIGRRAARMAVDRVLRPLGRLRR